MQGLPSRILSLIKSAHTVVQPSAEQGSHLQHKCACTDQGREYSRVQGIHPLPQTYSLSGQLINPLACRLTNSAVVKEHHLSVLDHAKLQGVYTELCIEVGLYPASHAFQNDQVCIPCLLHHFLRYLHAAISSPYWRQYCKIQCRGGSQYSQLGALLHMCDCWSAKLLHAQPYT